MTGWQGPLILFLPSNFECKSLNSTEEALRDPTVILRLATPRSRTPPAQRAQKRQ